VRIPIAVARTPPMFTPTNKTFDSDVSPRSSQIFSADLITLSNDELPELNEVSKRYIFGE
jgi:hypothetical protein